MEYRKKPVVIEAIKWDGGNHRERFDFLEFPEEAGKHSISSYGNNFYLDFGKVEGGLNIKTLEGERKVSIGDFIIKGISGEFYPCKPDIFDKTYEEVQ
jgi:hypothetical protein